MSGIHPVTVPKWGIEMQEGTLVAWRAQPGDRIQKGQELADIETEKIVNTLESPAGGVLRRIVADEGDTLAVGALVAVLADDGVSEENVDEFIAGFVPVDASFEPETGPGDSDAEPVGETTSTSAPATSAAGRISPVVRRLAERLGVDLAAVTGTGRNGRITKEDVQRAGAETPAAAAAAAEKTEGQPLTSMRRTIARRLQQSKQQLPHYYVRIDATVDAVIEQREQHGGASVNAFVLKATALALRAVPALNVHFDGDRVTQAANADICVAVATEAGLITPVLRSAQDKSVVEIHNETKVLAERARNGALNRDEIEGGSFTVSNLGMFGVSDFTAIINPPQVGILAVGAAERRPVVRDEQVVPATMTTLTLSADHRVIDGAVAAEFLATLKGALENPVNL